MAILPPLSPCGMNSDVLVGLSSLYMYSRFPLSLSGRLKLPKPFWCTTEVQHTDGSVKSFPLPEADGPFNFVNSSGLRYEAEEVGKNLVIRFIGRGESVE